MPRGPTACQVLLIRTPTTFSRAPARQSHGRSPALPCRTQPALITRLGREQELITWEISWPLSLSLSRSLIHPSGPCCTPAPPLPCACSLPLRRRHLRQFACVRVLTTATTPSTNRCLHVMMETKGGSKAKKSALQYESPLGYVIEDVRPHGGSEKFRTAAYSNCVRKPS